MSHQDSPKNPPDPNAAYDALAAAFEERAEQLQQAVYQAVPIYEERRVDLLSFFANAQAIGQLSLEELLKLPPGKIRAHGDLGAFRVVRKNIVQENIDSFSPEDATAITLLLDKAIQNLETYRKQSGHQN